MNNIGIGDEFFDLSRKIFVTVENITWMCNGKHINYVTMTISNSTSLIHLSDYSLRDKSKYLPVREERDKLALTLKYIN